ncbi:hypothetical protein AVEN_44887-1 [Araneus ventricosus]|uniref:Uncharacterized protein n=1 Tax=Araneus ventricosus TaxID=182803 RepID=A0A4Y2L719_ARAVE|nr:hypothetical protein AVEN_44887-1 [Araneus ventricosus]
MGTKRDTRQIGGSKVTRFSRVLVCFSLVSPVLNKIEGYFGTCLVNLNRGQMTRVTPELAPASPNFRNTPAGRHFTHVRFNVPQAHKQADLQWNRASHLKPFGSEAETLPQGHRGPCTS